MSRTINQQRPADAITEEALDAIDYAKCVAGWLSAVMRSIELDAAHNEGRNASQLAGLGQYLGDECYGYLTGEAERLRRELDAVGGEA